MAGLDYAGKTCLLEKTFNLKDPSLLAEMSPTQGVERQPYDFIGAEMIIWDLGGQVQYRDRYFDKPEMLQGTAALIFVVDIQDPDRFVEAASYWARILKIVEKEPVHKYILYHKFDPDKTGELKDNLVRAREIFSILKPFLGSPAVSFATSIYGDTADRAARQILWDILPPVELEELPTVEAKPPKKELLDIIPSPEEATRVDKVTERLALVLEEQLQKHDDFSALGIFKRDGTYVSGVAKTTSDKTLLRAAANALKTVGTSFVDEVESKKLSGPVPLDFEDFTACFEAISPEHMSVIFCSSSPTPVMFETMRKINRSLNQALGIIPAAVDSPEAIKLALMSELKTKLKKRKTLTDLQQYW